jgi:hypothetical protein
LESKLSDYLEVQEARSNIPGQLALNRAFLTVVLENMNGVDDTLELVYQSEEALTMLGLLYAQQEMFEQFVPAAGAMGTRQWQRITIFAVAAEKHQRYDLALAVDEACLKPGMHEAYLREKYEKLKSRIQDLSRNNELK